MSTRKVYLTPLIFLIFFSSCMQESFKYRKYEPYLSVDSIYRVTQEKLLFDSLKAKFLNTWRDSSNCYLKGKMNQLGNYTILDVYIDNILHTPNYDTLLFLFSRHEAFLDENKAIARYHDGEKIERVIGIPMVVTTHGRDWYYNCHPQYYKILATHGEPEDILRVRSELKRAVIRAGYFSKDKKPNSSFWRHLFNDKYIYTKGSTVNKGETKVILSK